MAKMTDGVKFPLLFQATRVGPDLGQLLGDLRSSSKRAEAEAQEKLKDLSVTEWTLKLLEVLHRPEGSIHLDDVRHAAKLLTITIPRHFLEIFAELGTEDRFQLLDLFIQCVNRWEADTLIRGELCSSFAMMILILSDTTDLLDERDKLLSDVWSHLRSNYGSVKRSIVRWAICGHLFEDACFLKKEMGLAMSLLGRDLQSKSERLVVEGMYALMIMAIGYSKDPQATDGVKHQLVDLFILGATRTWEWRTPSGTQKDGIFSGNEQMLSALWIFAEQYEGFLSATMISGVLLRIILLHLQRHGAPKLQLFSLTLDVIMSLLASYPQHPGTPDENVPRNDAARFIIRTLVRMIPTLSVGSTGQVNVDGSNEEPFHTGLFEIVEKKALQNLSSSDSFSSIYVEELDRLLPADPCEFSLCMAVYLASTTASTVCRRVLLQRMLLRIPQWLQSENLRKRHAAFYLVGRLSASGALTQRIDRDDVQICRRTIWSLMMSQDLHPMLRSLAYRCCMSCIHACDVLTGVSYAQEREEAKSILLSSIERELCQRYWTGESSVLDTLMECVAELVEYFGIPQKFRLATLSLLQSIATSFRTSGQHRSWGCPVVWRTRQVSTRNKDSSSCWKLSMLAIKCVLFDMREDFPEMPQQDVTWIVRALKDLQPAEAELNGFRDFPLDQVTELNNLWLELVQQSVSGNFHPAEERLLDVLPYALDSTIRLAAGLILSPRHEVDESPTATVQARGEQWVFFPADDTGRKRLICVDKTAYKAKKSAVEGLEWLLSHIPSSIARSVLHPFVLQDVGALLNPADSEDLNLSCLIMVQKWLDEVQHDHDLVRHNVSWLWGRLISILMECELNRAEAGDPGLLNVLIAEKTANCLIMLIPTYDEEQGALGTLLDQMLDAIAAKQADTDDASTIWYQLIVLHILKESTRSVSSEAKSDALHRMMCGLHSQLFRVPFYGQAPPALV